MDDNDYIHHMTAIVKPDRKQCIHYVIRENDSLKGRGWYPQRMSMNSFLKRQHFHDPNHVWSEGEPWGNRLEMNITTIHCDSVWDFYDKIHYDYKRKAFN